MHVQFVAFSQVVKPDHSCQSENFQLTCLKKAILQVFEKPVNACFFATADFARKEMHLRAIAFLRFHRRVIE